MSKHKHDEQELTFLHCQQCMKELPDKESPAEYDRISTAVTNDGNIMVWCNRHDREVATLTPQQIKDIAETQPCAVCDAGHEHKH